jgi:hypothetical protein
MILLLSLPHGERGSGRKVGFEWEGSAIGGATIATVLPENKEANNSRRDQRSGGIKT